MAKDISNLKLNKEQIDAIKFGSGALLIIAGAGTGKTTVAVALALQHVFSLCLSKNTPHHTTKLAHLRTKKTERTQQSTRDEMPKIVLTRPIIEAADEHLGFIPGSVDEKIAPYLEPAFAAVDKLKASMVVPESFDPRSLFKAVPLAYMRGHTIDHCGILEEAQNCNLAQLVCFLTRMGRDAKMIITADPSQHDRGRGRRAIVDVVKKLADFEEVGIVRATSEETLRDPFVTKVLRRLGVINLE